MIIAGKEFNSRLFLGTGKFNSNELMEKAIAASETEMVTVAMKRIELGDGRGLFSAAAAAGEQHRQQQGGEAEKCQQFLHARTPQ